MRVIQVSSSTQIIRVKSTTVTMKNVDVTTHSSVVATTNAGPMGPPGQIGPVGPQGPAGPSGVHVGTTEPETETVLWYDTN